MHSVCLGLAGLHCSLLRLRFALRFCTHFSDHSVKVDASQVPAVRRDLYLQNTTREYYDIYAARNGVLLGVKHLGVNQPPYCGTNTPVFRPTCQVWKSLLSQAWRSCRRSLRFCREHLQIEDIHHEKKEKKE